MIQVRVCGKMLYANARTSLASYSTLGALGRLNFNEYPSRDKQDVPPPQFKEFPSSQGIMRYIIITGPISVLK